MLVIFNDAQLIESMDFFAVRNTIIQCLQFASCAFVVISTNSLVQRKPFLVSLKGSDGCSEVTEPIVFPLPEHAFLSNP